jgi:hypothetical protein
MINQYAAGTLERVTVLLNELLGTCKRKESIILLMDSFLFE